MDYKPDGSGRDSYIITNSGGLKHNYVSNCNNFEKHLRTYSKGFWDQRAASRVKRLPFEGDISDYMNWRAPAVQLKERVHAKKLFDLSKRLSTSIPEHRRTPERSLTRPVSISLNLTHESPNKLTRNLAIRQKRVTPIRFYKQEEELKKKQMSLMDFKQKRINCNSLTPQSRELAKIKNNN